MFCINCRSINANWEALNELIYNMSNERFHFDIIGLAEIFKLNEGFNYSIAGYHDILSNTRHDSDDGHGGVGIYINENMSFFKRDDLTIFIPHVIESLFSLILMTLPELWHQRTFSHCIFLEKHSKLNWLIILGGIAITSTENKYLRSTVERRLNCPVIVTVAGIQRIDTVS